MIILIGSDFSLEKLSGAPETVNSTAEALRERGHTVDIFWHDESLRLGPNLRRFFGLPNRQLKQTKAAFSRKIYDVAIISQPHCFKAFRWIKRRYPQTVCINRSHGWELRYHDAKNQYLYQDSIESSWKQFKRLIIFNLTRRHARLVCAEADGVMTLCTQCVDFIEKSHQTLPSNTVSIPPGVDESFKYTSSNPSFNDSNFKELKLVYAGQWLPVKGTHYVRKLIADLIKNDICFNIIFIVNNLAVKELENEFKDYDRTRIQIREWQNRNELNNIYNKSDAFVFTSLVEGFGKTVLEAMRSGLCPIGFDEGCLRDIGRDRINCLKSPVGDYDAFFRNICFAAENLQTVKSFGRQASIDTSNMSWDLSASRIEDFVENLKSSKTSS